MVQNSDPLSGLPGVPLALVVPMWYTSNGGGQTLPVGMQLHAGAAFYGPSEGVSVPHGSNDVTVFIHVSTSGTLAKAVKLTQGSAIVSIQYA